MLVQIEGLMRFEKMEPPLIKATNLLWPCGENFRSRVRASSRIAASSERRSAGHHERGKRPPCACMKRERMH
jgi:hypothetical protein